MKRTYCRGSIDDRLRAHSIRSDEQTCWLWVGCKNGAGYGMLRVDHHAQLAHRLSLSLVVGPIPDDVFVLHACDNPTCINPAHLFVGDAKANSADMCAKDRASRGERNVHAKLNDNAVRAMRIAAETNRAIAARLGVNASTVSRARAGKTWTCVEVNHPNKF